MRVHMPGTGPHRETRRDGRTATLTGPLMLGSHADTVRAWVI